MARDQTEDFFLSKCHIIYQKIKKNLLVNHVTHVPDRNIHFKHFYTQKLLHTAAFTHRHFYTGTFTQRLLIPQR